MDGATIQEVLAAAVAAGAALYVIRRLTGWPRRRKPPTQLVEPRGRLATGLEKARRNRKERRDVE